MLTQVFGWRHSNFSRPKYYWSFLSLIPALILSKFFVGFGSFALYVPPLLSLGLCAWFGGVGPALFVQVCGALATFTLFDHPGNLAQIKASQVYGLAAFILVGKLILFLTAYFRWGRDLRSRERSLRLLAEATHDLIWDWDIRRNTLSLTGNLSGILGAPNSTLKKNLAWWQSRIHPDDSAAVSNELNKLLTNARDASDQEYRLSRDDGSYAIVTFRGTAIRNRAGQTTNIVGGLSDITALRKAQERLAFDALHDDLTGLPNRRYLREQLQQILAEESSVNSRCAVLFLDLDRFKTVNDSLGHTAGDNLLKGVSQRIVAALQPDEFMARFGADEFTILLDDTDGVAAAVNVADRVKDCLVKPFDLEGHSVVVTASIGIALAVRGDGPEEVLRHADVAMYRAKARGRARFEIFESDRDKSRMNLVQLESEIRKALLNQEFRVYHQPIVALTSGKLIGAESLVRWQHPQRGLILPNEFLPIAEESGMISELGNWILSTTCEHLRMWRSASPSASDLYVTVNVAQRQLFDPKLPNFVLSCLRDNGLGVNDIVLELTENIVFSSHDEAAARMLRCRSLGLRFALDDFGKGYSSIARVHDLPISMIKIDGSFVKAISDGKAALADAAVALGRTLGLEVTAEFVETNEQVRHLKDLGCTAAQGSFYSGPLDYESFLSLVCSQPYQMYSFHATG